jgi:hypothetical protein
MALRSSAVRQGRETWASSSAGQKVTRELCGQPAPRKSSELRNRPWRGAAVSYAVGRGGTPREPCAMADSYRCQAADRQPQKQRGGDGHVLVQKLIFTYDSWPIPRPKKLATSPTFHGRWISNTNGSNRPSNKHFCKEVLSFSKN